jgi:hypothetical protein
MRLRIKKQTNKVEKVNLAHLKAYKIKGRTKASAMYRLSQMRAYEIRQMFKNVSVETELRDKVEARLNTSYFIAYSKQLIYQA